MPEHRKAPVPAFLCEEARLWEPCTEGMQSPLQLSCGLRIVRLSVVFPALAGRKILFFSDLHVRSHSVISLFPFCRINGGISWIQKAFSEMLDIIGRPDMILFGGDLAAEASLIGPVVNWLASAFPADVPKFSAAGNWEMRRIWLNRTRWRDIFARAGFTLLSSSDFFNTDFIEIRSLADYKEEQQTLPCPYRNPKAFHSVITHNPDSVVALRNPDFLGNTQFIFAGHTHGGQLRIPGYGALITSSRLGKKFEYGLFRHKIYGTELFVTAGIGTTWIPFRFCCAPEVVLLSFV